MEPVRYENWTSALLVGIGISMIDLGAVISAFSPLYMLLVLVIVVCVSIGAGISGYLVGFYPVESAITAGLCTTNMGGTHGMIEPFRTLNKSERFAPGFICVFYTFRRSLPSSIS